MSIRDRSASVNISAREKLILAGLYLSKYDAAGLAKLGFDSFQEDSIRLQLICARLSEAYNSPTAIS
jgi:hypothetical protein